VPVKLLLDENLSPRVALGLQAMGAGQYHARRRASDARRDRALAKMGYRVLRLDAELVEKQPREALERIRAAIGLP
jgi:predicted nuclease of predicted toxin-antitoxin system